MLVMILACGFRADYLAPDTTPFLWRQAEAGSHVPEVHPSPGFCERSEIFAGVPSSVSGNFCAIGRDPEHSPYRRWKWFLKGLSTLSGRQSEPSQLVRRLLRRAQPALSSHPFRPYNIPLRDLHLYRLTEDHWRLDDPRAFDRRTLFDDLRDRGMRWSLASFTSLRDRRGGTDDERSRKALEAVRAGIDFVPVYIGAADEMGHRLGPRADDLRQGLTRLDRVIGDLVTSIWRLRGDATVMFLGDHGMEMVNHVFDPRPIMADLRRSHGDRIDAFMDSTMLRFWCRDDAAHGAVREVLSSSQGAAEMGDLVDLQEQGLDRDLYGHVMWAARPGVVISPDYFHRDPPKGMHGYMETTPGLAGTLVSSADLGGGVPARVQLHDVRELVGRLLA